jgi:hypothetical protein
VRFTDGLEIWFRSLNLPATVVGLFVRHFARLNSTRKSAWTLCLAPETLARIRTADPSQNRVIRGPDGGKAQTVINDLNFDDGITCRIYGNGLVVACTASLGGQRAMRLIVLLVVLILLFGGGGFYYGPSYHYYGGGLGLVLLVVLLVLLLRRRV